MKIEHIAIWVSDLEKMKLFYHQYFGGTPGQIYHNSRAHFSSYFLTFENGARLELMHKPEVMVNRDELHIQYTGLCHFAFSLGSGSAVDALTYKLQADGYKVLREPRTTGDGYYESVVLDPEDNTVELTI